MILEGISSLGEVYATHVLGNLYAERDQVVEPCECEDCTLEQRENTHSDAVYEALL